MENINCSKPLTSYQIANLSDEEVKSKFVVRQKEFERILSEIRRDDMKGSIQHYLIIGRRGSGKSTLLRRIEAEIKTDQSLSESLIVINLSEEQAGIYRLYDLWDYVLRYLKSNSFSITAEPQWNEKLNNADYSKELYYTIQNTLMVSGKKLVLLLDNIDRIFDNLGEDAHLLREILTNFKDIRIIGASTRMSEHYWQYDKPFYQFFRIIKLNSLDTDEVKELLFHWAGCIQNSEIADFLHKNSGKIDTIRVLTDGMPRTLLNFIELLTDRPKQNGYDYLHLILDRATPLYQERLNSFPPAQRKIIIELANYWEAVKVGALVEVCKMPGKTISAQLNQLVGEGVVEKIKGNKKDNLYCLSERFFNLWLIMTQGGLNEKTKVKYLTVFLENIYNPEKLKEPVPAYPELKSMKTEEPEPGYRPTSEISKDEVENTYLSQIFRIIMMFRDNDFIDATKQVEITVPLLINSEEIEGLSLLINELIVYQQYNLAWQLFNNEEYGVKLKDLVRPLYYVCAGFLTPKERGEELLKPGSELTESIELITNAILERQKLYE